MAHWNRIGGLRAAVPLLLAAALSGCLGGAKLPPTLMVLTPATAAPAGGGSAGTVGNALAVTDIAAPERLDTVRVPVQVSDTSVAYLENAAWVDKPAKLFGQLLAERIRSGGTRLVIDGVDRQYTAAHRLTGQLGEMGYNASAMAVVVRFDAHLEGPEGAIRTRRFESTVPGISADPAQIAPALNRAANEVAEQVAEWVG